MRQELTGDDFLVNDGLMQAQKPPEVPAQRSAPPPAQPRAPPVSNGYKRPRGNVAPSAQHSKPPQPRASHAAGSSEDWDGEVVFDVPDSDRGEASTPGSGGSKGQPPHANGSLHGGRLHNPGQSNGLQGRDMQANGGHAGGTSSSAREQLDKAEAERKVRAAQEELAALRRGIAEREQRLAREQVRDMPTKPATSTEDCACYLRKNAPFANSS